MSYTNIDNSIMSFNISDGAFKLFFLLQSMCYNEKTECFPSQNYLAEKLNKSVRTIQRYIEELINAGLLKKQRRGSISNLYTVMLKVVTQKVNALVEKVKDMKDKNTKAQSHKGYGYNYPSKKSNWNIEERSYDFGCLENMLLGQEEYNAEKLYK
ncbi:helix-turn-helix domain-containing protein [Desnuesiella massiliensis]|uniref:helix-turn-helix domain-containing protein n=1 Tax=Desnuesiella massiliensis TaxID=1650662 RepID=UPI0006E176A4|nr:helix-turn-helix domain-containing protein [Desnuesiella massiliensis]